MVTCSECQAMNPEGLTHCVECAAPLLAPEEHEALLQERIEANAALRRGYRKLAGVTWLYRLGALAYALVTVAAIVGLASPLVPLRPGILVVGLCTALTVVMLMGALQILFRPFAWTVAVAVLATAVSAAHLVGPNPLGLAFAWSTLWAVLFWIAVPPTRRFQRLIAEHTDLYILHHSSRSTRRSVSGRGGKARHERLVDSMRKANRRAWGLSAAGAALAVALASFGTYTVCAAVRPPDLSTAIADFETDWNRGDFAAIGQLFPAAVRSQRAAWVAGIADGNGWVRRPPQLAAGRRREDADESDAWIDYALGETTVSAHWVLHDRSWLLAEMELPIPPLEPALERFRRAWKASDVQAVCAFFPEAHRSVMVDAIERAAVLRKWDPYPELGPGQRSVGPDGEIIVAFPLPGGELTTKWVFRPNGTWGLRGLQPPPR